MLVFLNEVILIYRSCQIHISPEAQFCFSPPTSATQTPHRSAAVTVSPVLLVSSKTKLDCRRRSSQLPYLRGGDREAELRLGIPSRPRIGRWGGVGAGSAIKQQQQQQQQAGIDVKWLGPISRGRHANPRKCISEIQKQMTLWQRASRCVQKEAAHAELLGPQHKSHSWLNSRHRSQNKLWL